MPSDEWIDQVLGHYRILRQLGYGGTSTVYLAQDINLHREVAVKVFRPHAGETQDFLRRFAREARVLAQLDHPNILPVYDYGEQHDTAYLVMPYVAGGSLRDRLQKYGPLPTAEVIQLSSQILGALQYAHKRGLIHRDIKPGNLLCKTDDTLLLSDFGLVKILPTESVTTQQGETLTIGEQGIAGTPEYMAPEQIRGQAVQASDIYSMGAVIYEMLTGVHLFTAENYVGVLVQHLYEQPRPLRAFKPQISPGLEAVIMRALEKDPARRYQSAADFQQALALAGAQSSTSGMNGGATIQAQSSETWASRPDSPLPVAPYNAYAANTPPASQLGSSPSNYSSPQQGPPALQTPPAYLDRQQPVSSYPVPNTKNKQTPLIITLVMLMVVILVSTASLLYAKGVFGPIAGRGPTVLPATPTNDSTVTKGGATPIPTGSAQAPALTVSVPPTTVDCPAPGTARALVSAPLALGTHQNVVYIVNEGPIDQPTFGTVKRRDMSVDSQGVEIAKMPNLHVSNGQVSQDGQWVLFTAWSPPDHYQLRAVRVDGQGLQTLYCGQYITGVQWSFDQKSIVFDDGLDKPITYLLTVSNGRVQAALVPQGRMAFRPKTWLDNNRIYLTSFLPRGDGPEQNIYILDIRKGSDQHEGDLQQVLMATLSCLEFDSSYDSQQMFISHCTPAPVGIMSPDGPSTIDVLPAAGGTAQQIYTNPIRAVTTVRAVAPSILLLMIENLSLPPDAPASMKAALKGDGSMNGLWRMNPDGSHLQRLMTDSNNLQSLCPFSQYAWSNVSRDGSLYAIQGHNGQKNEFLLSVGSMNGGQVNTFADISDGTELFLVGWTNV